MDDSTRTMRLHTEPPVPPTPDPDAEPARQPPLPPGTPIPAQPMEDPPPGSPDAPREPPPPIIAAARVAQPRIELP